MTLRRVAALAQALAIASIILAPGLQPGGPASARAAMTPVDPATEVIFDATGNSIGCQAGSRKFKGPREPRDPPWPPGAEPTPSPSTVPSPDASGGPGLTEPGLTEPESSSEPLAQQGTISLASTGMRVAQAEPVPEPSASPDAVDSPGTTAEAINAPKGDRGKSRFIAGIDVSHHNQDIDFGKVRDADKHFVFIKATESNDFVDPRFATNIVAARAAGLAASGYHVFDYTLDGKAQADHFVDRLEATDALEGTLPPVIDVECWGYRGTSTHVVSEARLRDFVARLYQRTGRLPILYTSLYMWSQVVGDATGFEDLPLWAVCWSCAEPRLAAGWDDWVFWQTGASRIKGLGKKLDGNVFSGSVEDLDAMKLRPVVIAGGAVVTGSQRVELDLGGRDADQVRTSTDGEQWSAWSPVRPTVRAELAAEEGQQTLHVQLRAGKGTRSPVFRDSITLDRSGPEVEGLAVSLREGSLGSEPSSIPVSVTWRARDELAGLADAIVSVACADEQVQRVEAPGSAAAGEAADWDAQTSVIPDTACEVTAVSRDAVGNTTRRSVADLMAAMVPALDGAATVRGAQVGIIAQRGPDAGRAAITLGGEAVALVDLYAPENRGPEIVHVLELEPAASHVIEVTATGTSDPASGGTSVALEGFVTLSA